MTMDSLPDTAVHAPIDTSNPTLHVHTFVPTLVQKALVTHVSPVVAQLVSVK